MKKYLALLSALAFMLIVIVFAVIGSGNNSDSSRKVRVINNKIESRFSITSEKDGFMGSFFGTTNEISLSKGSQKLTFQATGYDTVNIELSGEDSEIEIEFNKESAKNQASSIVGAGPSIESAEYFAENTWMIAGVKHGSVIADAEIVISKKVGDNWRPVSQGSAVDIDYLISVGAPSDLIKYIESL